MKVDIDLFYLTVVSIMFLVALCALAVTNHALRRADQLTKQLAAAEARAAKWHALAGMSVFEPQRRRHVAELPTQLIPRVNERHIVPMSQGGRYTDGT